MLIKSESANDVQNVDRSVLRSLPDARLRAIRRLRDSGIDASVNVMPVLPGITDRPDQLDALVRAIAGSGAIAIYACALHLRATPRRRYFPFIRDEFPELEARYRATYSKGHTAGARYREGLTRIMRRLCRGHGIAYGRTAQDDVEELAATPDEAQLELPLAMGVVNDAQRTEMSMTSNTRVEFRGMAP
jgi:DNA repair photolyase